MKKLFAIVILVMCLSNFVLAASSEAPPKRIISLAPSVTEILFALGLGDKIVGVTTFCDYPEEAKKKPKIGGMSNPSLEAILSLKPDIVVMTTDGNPKEFAERLRSLNIKTYIFTARRLHELPQGIRDMGLALGVQGESGKIAREIEKAIESVRGKYSAHRGIHRKKLLFIIWPEPLIAAGPDTVIDDVVSLLGYENIAATARTPYPKYSLEEVIHEAPDVLIIGSATGMDMRAVSQGFMNKLTIVPAVKEGAICYTGDKLYRLGPRVIKGIEELAECLK